MTLDQIATWSALAAIGAVMVAGVVAFWPDSTQRRDDWALYVIEASLLVLLLANALRVIL